MDKIQKKINWESLINLLKERYKYILIILMATVGLYLLLDDKMVNAPRKLLIVTALVFSIIMFIPGKFHNRVFLSVVLSGTLFAYLTPVMDTPDENVHYARALYLSDGHLYVPNEVEQSKVAEDIEDVEKVFKSPLILSHLEKEEVTDNKVIYTGILKTNGYSFVSYIPQTVGILIARLLHLSVAFSIILGRFLNVLIYGILVRLAVKKAKSQRYILATVVLLPMSIYIAASFNQDAMANGLIFLLIGLFCEYIGKEKISYIDLIVFSIISLLLATMKFPYVLMIGLLLFLPPKKMNLKKYVVIVTAVIVTMFLSLLWLRLSSSVNLQLVSENPDINPIAKISYTIQNFRLFFRLVLRELFYLVPSKLQSAFTFGWLSYGLDFSWLYIAYLTAVFVMLPRPKYFNNWSRIGIVLVSLGITLGILMTAYLMWNPVGDMSFAGVQGRYFIGIFALIGLVTNLFSNSYSKLDAKKLDNTLILISNLFILALVVRTLVEYYQF